MPGILPMKVIKVGTNAQTRIAQACDRCRSKKIRCDGIRPCCTQCANVGFECRTSDKLSRRAFPRGYTESLEERVRALECEVRELKDLLDGKDEKIDMLSRIHSQSPRAGHLPSPRRQSTTSEHPANAKVAPPPKDETFKVQQSANLHDALYFAGTSNSRALVEAFKIQVEESGRSTADVDTEQLLSIGESDSSHAASSPPPPAIIFKPPPRILSDQLVNIFFQEWAPLFPVLHRPTFLILYDRYIRDSDSVTDKAEIASLNLVFGIAALSSGTKTSLSLDLKSCEMQWKAAVDAIIVDNSLPTLQALILAQIYCIQKGDHSRLVTYTGLATALSARLGLHQSQKRFPVGALTCETRKKVFWTLYTVDGFASVVLGLPKHIKDEDVQCEYPVDTDDEYVTEKGFLPTLPGESTKLSSALALFRASRILSKVLQHVFPAQDLYEVSMTKLGELTDELDGWHDSLPPHLRLQFAQDKPSTGTVSSRSPLLSFAYHYIRALLHRPAVCALRGARASPSMIAMASSSKRMYQIYQLLQERGLSFSFCLNLDETLVVAGFGLLLQGFSLEVNSNLLKDNAHTIFGIAETLEASQAPCAAAFEHVATSYILLQTDGNGQSPSLPSAHAHAQSPNPSTKSHLKAIASRFSAINASKAGGTEGNRRSSTYHISLHPRSPSTQSQPSLMPSSSYPPAPTSRSEPARSPGNMSSRPTPPGSCLSVPPSVKPKVRPDAPKLPNLDYLSFGNEPDPPPSRHSQQPVKPDPGPSDWEKLLGSLDNGDGNIYDACFGSGEAQPLDALRDPSLPRSSSELKNSSSTALINPADAWNQDLWASLYHTDTNTSAESCGMTSSGQAGSILSFSTDEGFSSCEDISASDWATNSSNTSSEAFRGILIAEASPGQADEFRASPLWDSGVPL